MKDLYSIVIATTDLALDNFTPAFKDRIGKTMVYSKRRVGRNNKEKGG